MGRENKSFTHGNRNVASSYFPIIPTGPMMYIEINNWDDLPKISEESLTIGMMPAKGDF